MKIIKEAVIFFAIVLLLLLGAVYLDKAPDLLEKFSLGGFAKAGKVNISANLNFDQLELNADARKSDLSLSFFKINEPILLNNIQLEITEGQHLLDLNDYTGKIYLNKGNELIIKLDGSLDTLKLDQVTMYSNVTIKASLTGTNYIVNKIALNLAIALKSGTLRAGNMNINFAEGDRIELKNFNGILELNLMQSAVLLDGSVDGITVRTPSQQVSIS